MPSTIFALSSGTPPAGIAVVRISGPDADAALGALTGGRALPAPRAAAVRRLIDPETGETIDQALVLRFCAPRSATGDDLVELHLHGGRAIVARMLAVLAKLPGLTPAEPGGFTRRALENGRIDLTEAEGLGDLLAAETESQRRLAIAVVEGGVSRLVEQWAERCVSLSASIEALVDHGDEEDVSASGEEQVVAGIQAESAALAAEIDVYVSAPPLERLRDGIRVVLAGAPNTGKSTLLNCLVDRDAAIVSPIAGTTRDRIEAPVSRDGIPYVLIDTAGLRHSDDAIERIGVARSREAMQAADIVLWLDDEPPPLKSDHVISLHARRDQPGRVEVPPDRIGISAVTGFGIDALWTELARHAQTLVPQVDRIALNQRQRAHAASACDRLGEATRTNDLLLIAENIRAARACFDRVTGRADSETMLDVLFGRFCIGK